MIKNRRVLVVDDHAATRVVVARALREMHLEVLEASTSAGALEEVAARPGLVIMARYVGDMSAPELRRILGELDLEADVLVYDARVVLTTRDAAPILDAIRKKLARAA